MQLAKSLVVADYSQSKLNKDARQRMRNGTNMEITLYNTLSRRKEKFVPIDPENVRMYVCGPTVYDFAHIGNARPVVVFDVLFRLLRHAYGENNVVFVRNITDVDDKINERAKKENISINELTERTMRQFHEDVSALGTLNPTFEPRATEHISEMIDMISVLIGKGHAYEADGHVLFHVPSMQEYGQLSNRTVKDMIAGARVEVAPYKKDPMDFVLWKPSESWEPSWDSPWSAGRPGWHIECSAMSKKHLGQVFDIHGGGIDLIFPHHENEIAQSRCAFDTGSMANIWMHNGFLQVEGEKMAKSRGNFITIRELLQDWPGEVVRLALLMTQYRQPIDFTSSGLEEAKGMLDGWYKMLDGAGSAESADTDFLEALANDLNTPNAIATMHRLKAKVAKGEKQAAKNLKSCGNLLGLLQHTPDEWFDMKRTVSSVDESEVERLIVLRSEARKDKDFKKSDEIRDKIAEMGIVLNDTRNSETGEIETTWQYK